MKEYIFKQSIAGPDCNYRKGQVVALDDLDAKKFIVAEVAEPYDNHVTEVKAKAAKVYKKKATRKKTTTKK